jgi:septum site-determining protein MinC
MADPITIKGIRDGLLVTISDGEAWNVAASGMLARIDHTPDFFKGGRVALAVGGRAIPVAELGRLRDQLSERGVSLWTVLSDSAVTTSAAQALGLNIALPTATPPRRPMPAPEASSDEEGEAALLVRRTLRSGRSVRSAGHLIVVGDVNPGAEVAADGDIIVWGHLRGVAHAGARGNTEAIVCALDLSPTQLRIAEFITVSPKRKGDPKPELARVKNGQIVAEQWKGGKK